MKYKTAIALCATCLVLGFFWTGCLPVAPDTETDVSLSQVNASETVLPEVTETETTLGEYILSLNTKKFHRKNCQWVNNIKPENKDTFTGDRDTLIAQGYESCGTCHP